MNGVSDPEQRRTLLERALRAVEEVQSKLEALKREKREPIAIIGMGCRFPGHVASPEAYWNLLRDGVNAICEVPASRWDIEAYYDPNPDLPGKMYTRMGGFLDHVDEFDTQFFGMSPRETIKTDPQQRIVLEVSWEALENAAIDATSLIGTQTGVFLGITNNDYARVIERAGSESIDAYHLTGNCLNFAAGRVAYSFGLQGPTMAVDTACSSSGVTIHLACQSLRNRECNLALAGGVNLILSPEINITSTKARTLSPDGYCKTFDASANGYVRGEGCGLVVLKRLSDALADGDNIQALILGSAVNQDGATSGITVPNKLAQIEVMRQALERAGIEPNQVDFVEAHGTGTPLGDPIEVRALAAVYSRGRSANEPLIIGTAKTNIGHLESAAGVAGLMKAVLSLQHGTIPPHLHFTQINPAIALEEIPAAIPLQLMSWKRDGRARVGGVSFFGGSGTIGHMIVQEAPEIKDPPAHNCRSSQLFCLSAKDQPALHDLMDRYGAWLNEASPAVRDVCYTVDAGRSHFKHRTAIVTSSSQELLDRLADVRADNQSAGAMYGETSGTQKPRIAFLFTGQGGQYANMGRRLYEGEPIYRRVIDQCDELSQPYLQQSLRSVLYPESPDATPLDNTQYTHVAMFAVQYGLASLWHSWGVEPSIIMGHSVGEIVAATVAGQMSFEDGLKLMCERGRLMQTLPASGLMASLLLDDKQAAAALEPYRDRVAIAAINGPESTVISGESTAVQAVVTQLERAGTKVKLLRVSNAFHSPLVEPILAEFEEIASQLRYRSPHTALFSSMRLETVEEHSLLEAPYWRQNLRSTVRFSEAIRKLYERDYRIFVEIGPSPILVSMGSQCVPIGEGVWLPSIRQDRDDWQQMLETLGRLYVSGMDVNWSGFYKDRRARKISLPTYPFRRERYWVDSPHGAQRSVSGGVAQDTRTGHPLLGRRLRSAIRIFEQQLSAAGLPFLRDHCLFCQPVLPVTAYLELALAAASQTFESGHASVKNMVLHQPLALPDSTETTIQVTVSETETGCASFKIFSLQADGQKRNTTWMTHATGDLCLEEEDDGASQFANLADVQQRCSNKIELESYFQSLRLRGLEFGPAFRGLRQLWSQGSEAIGYITLPDVIASETEKYSVHPAFMDACLQPILAALPIQANSTSQTHTYLPQRLERLRLYCRPAGRVWSHVMLRSPSAADAIEITADVEILDPAGQRICELRGLVLRRAAPGAIIGSQGANFSTWLYKLSWEQLPLPAHLIEVSSACLRGPKEIAEALVPCLQQYCLDKGLEEFASLLPRLEALSTQYVWQALHELGCTVRQDDVFTTHSKARELGIPDRYDRLLARMFEILAEDGYLRQQGQRWKVSHVPPVPNPDMYLGNLIEEYPACSAELVLTRRCGEHFARAIKNQSDPLELLFPDGSLKDVEGLYQNSPYFRLHNRLIQQALVKATDGFRPSRPLRILEIGGGTGSTTSYVLPKLQAQQTEYVFTDLSSFFISKVRDKFAAYPFIDYRILDIEKSPVEQGFKTGYFDIVIAANVLHATADLRQTLKHVRSLLSSEGLLILLEATRRLRFADVIVGLTEGWWRFTDTQVRPSHALLSQSQWQHLLGESEFGEVAVCPEQDETNVLSNQSVIIARGSSAESKKAEPNLALPKEEGIWLVFADDSGVAKAIETALDSRGERSVFVSAGTEYARQDRTHFAIDPACLDNLQRLIHELGFSNDCLAKEVVYLWPLNNSSGLINDWGALKEAIQSKTRSLLHLIQALVSGGIPLTKNLWIVSRGLYPVDSEIGFASLSQSLASALGGTIGLEYPELHCTRFDLDPVGSPSEVQALLQEIASGKNADLVAFRSGERFVGRLVRDEIEHQKAPNIHNIIKAPYQLQSSSPGILDSLSLAPSKRRPPNQGEVEIEVHASGLGFRDILMALGQYPGNSHILGYECAGKIVNVGGGVERFRVGQRVLAVGPNAFSAFLTISVDRIAAIPDTVRDDEAATIPSAFLTAQYALYRLGKLSAGDRVLIHAAAGGVGLAAVQLAQLAGAEIFATAGSPAKRSYLKSLGVAHVMDSRSLAFADEIMETTGGKGVDLVLNSLADRFIPTSLAVTARNGRFLELGKTGIWDSFEVAQLDKDITYFTIDLSSVFDQGPALIQNLFDELIPDLARGRLKPLPLKLFPIDESTAAFRYMAQARHIGKVVLIHPAYDGQSAKSESADGRRDGMLRAESSYLITGGLRGLGLLVAQWMSERGATHLVLTGRSSPSESALAAICEMEKNGTRVVVERGDVSDGEHVEALFSKFGRVLPPLRGIVHSAGTLEDGVLAEQSWERFEKVMAPKVNGAWHLHTLSQNHPLDFFILFSSAVSLLGSPGQGNHVVACAFQDALAHYRHSLGLPALSIDWGPWSEVGAATQGDIAQRLERKGLRPITPREGLQVLECLLSCDRAQIGVMRADWGVFADSLPPDYPPSVFSKLLSEGAVPAAVEKPAFSRQPALLDQLNQASPNKRRGLLEAHIREQAIKVLGLKPSFKLDPNQGLATLGLDSLMTIELKNRLQASIGKALSSTIVFDHPTVAELAEYLEQDVLKLEAKPKAAATSVDTNTLDLSDRQSKTLTELDRVSDAEAEAILERELSGYS